MVWHSPNGVELNKKLTKQITGNEGAYLSGSSPDFQVLQQELKKMKTELLSERSWLWEEFDLDGVGEEDEDSEEWE